MKITCIENFVLLKILLFDFETTTQNLCEESDKRSEGFA